jgi:hypothetical protein
MMMVMVFVGGLVILAIFSSARKRGFVGSIKREIARHIDQNLCAPGMVSRLFTPCLTTRRAPGYGHSRSISGIARLTIPHG